MVVGWLEHMLPAIAVGAVFALVGLLPDLLVLREMRRHSRDHRQHLEDLFALHQARMAQLHTGAPTHTDEPTDPH